MTKQTIVLALFHCLFQCAAAVTCGEERQNAQKPAQLDAQVSVKMSYLVYVPPNYDEKKSWPLLIFLHGSGARGSDLERVKANGPPKLIDEGKDFPFIVVSPQCPKGSTWEPIELVALLNELERTHKVDSDRIYVTGLSLGGFGTWELAAFAPHRLAAIAPICGGGETSWARQMKHVPVWAFHGARDTVVRPRRSREMVDALKRRGGQPLLSIYPEAAHDAWTETYDNPKLYEWFLKQKRKTVPPRPTGSPKKN